LPEVESGWFYVSLLRYLRIFAYLPWEFRGTSFSCEQSEALKVRPVFMEPNNVHDHMEGGYGDMFIK
jgi:hypothetical protein